MPDLSVTWEASLGLDYVASPRKGMIKCFNRFKQIYPAFHYGKCQTTCKAFDELRFHNTLKKEDIMMQKSLSHRWKGRTCLAFLWAAFMCDHPFWKVYTGPWGHQEALMALSSVPCTQQPVSLRYCKLIKGLYIEMLLKDGVWWCI